MSEHENLLVTYSDLIARASTLMEEEMEQLKVSGEPAPEFLERKKSLLQEMDGALRALKTLSQNGGGVPPELKESFDALQHKFMRVIKMDRELEKTYLANQQSARKVDMGDSVDRAGAKRLYGL